jgi:hypothetical protein
VNWSIVTGPRRIGIHGRFFLSPVPPFRSLANNKRARLPICVTHSDFPVVSLLPNPSSSCFRFVRGRAVSSDWRSKVPHHRNTLTSTCFQNGANHNDPCSQKQTCTISDKTEGQKRADPDSCMRFTKCSTKTVASVIFVLLFLVAA